MGCTTSIDKESNHLGARVMRARDPHGPGRQYARGPGTLATLAEVPS